MGIIQDIVAFLTGSVSGISVEETGDGGVVITADVSQYLDADEVVASASMDDGELTVTVEPDMSTEE